MQVLRTGHFDRWLAGLRDRTAQKRISLRLGRIETDDYLGISRSVGGGVSKIKLDFGPGYRLYYTLRGTEVILLLAGGDKATQVSDILIAQRLAEELRRENDDAPGH